MTGNSTRLTYANLTSTLALVIALGGGVAVAADKIDGHQIKKGSISGKQIKNGGLTGQDLNASVLASVNAASVDGKSAVCGAGTLEYAGGCWETATTPGVNWTQAVNACASRGGLLPSSGGLIGFTTSKAVPLAGEWVDDLSYDPNVPAIRTFKISSGSGIQNADMNETHAYRCVLPLVHS
jgi:hypothetical protein